MSYTSSPGALARSALSPGAGRPARSGASDARRGSTAVSTISAHDYSEIAKANREKALLEAELRAKIVAQAALRAEQEKLKAWAVKIVPFWSREIPEAVARSLRMAMKVGLDLSGHASHREAHEHGELIVRDSAGGLLLRYARIAKPTAKGSQEAFPDPSHFPGVPEEAFTWNYHAIRDFQEFSYCLPGVWQQTVDRRSVFSFLDLAAAAAGLPSVTQTWATIFPGFDVEMGKYTEEGGVPHVAYYMRIYIPTHDDGSAGGAGRSSPGGPAISVSSLGKSMSR